MWSFGQTTSYKHVKWVIVVQRSGDPTTQLCEGGVNVVKAVAMEHSAFHYLQLQRDSLGNYAGIESPIYNLQLRVNQSSSSPTLWLHEMTERAKT